jgi:hypothetical protein
MHKSLLLAAVVTAVACTTSARADNLLDQQLGGVPNPAVAPAAPKPVAGPSTADIVSPDAVRKVDDLDLVNKLTQPDDPSKQAGQVKEKFTDMIARMGQSQDRLVSRDPGEVTQETQRRIIGDLDVLIEIARQQCNKVSKPQDPDKQQQNQKSYSQGRGQSQGGSTAAGSSFLPRGGSVDPQTSGDIHSHGQNEWGTLPSKDRDLVSHGANEQYLSSYRDMIDRYYQALAELGKTHNL